MNSIFKLFLSMSVSGSLMILALLFLKSLLRNKISRQWQYYAWLIVIARLLLPITPDESLVGNLFRWADQASSVPAAVYDGDESMKSTPYGDNPMDDTMRSLLGNRFESGIPSQKGTLSEASASAQDSAAFGYTDPSKGENISAVFGYLWILWLTGALVLLARKITAYQSYARYIRAGCREVADIAMLDLLAREEVWAGVKRPVELYVNNMVSSPMLLGLFRPCIILPTADLSQDEFLCTVRHELIHYRRWDMPYKWLVQITICLHWFNPLVYLMGRELGRACELSCDEAVIRSLDQQGRRAYGDTLLHAVRPGGVCREPFASVLLGESATLLRERLDAIMKYKKMSKKGCCAALLVSAALAFAFAASGAYAAEAAVGNRTAVPVKAVDVPDNMPSGTGVVPETEMETLEIKGITYYLVFNEEQLRAIGTGRYGMDLNYMQQADIQLSDEEWMPIGTMENPFTGSYNGNGYEIAGLTMKNPDAAVVGMFGVAENAHIYNITLRDYDIMDAGKNVSALAIAPILPLALGDARSYDNFVYPKEAATAPEMADSGSSDVLADEYYGVNLPQFSYAFAALDENAQGAWLERIYNDGEIAFFSVSLQQLDVDNPLTTALAQKAYEDGKISFFSVLTDHMGAKTLEAWLDKAKQENRVSFQSVILKALDRDWELEALEEELERQQLEEYGNYGITREGKAYYYQGQMVNIFLDHQSGSAFYRLDMNPNGVVNIKITRGEDGTIQSVDYMTEQEVEELFGER